MFPVEPEDLEASLGRLQEELGYGSGSTAASPDPRVGHIYRLARDAGVIDFYSVATSVDSQQLPPSPVVFVAKADSAERAREIRRLVWCLGQAPFLIIVLPGQVRVYTSARFSATDDRVGLLASASSTSEAIRSQLARFNKNEIDSGRIWQAYGQEIRTEDRVDLHLLRNLRKLSSHLIGSMDLRVDIAHSLIGKYIYLRYLLDRKILTQKWMVQNSLDPASVLGEGATLSGLKSFVMAIEARFNGSIFPLPLVGPDAPTDEAIGFVAKAILGQEPWSDQAVFDFNLYDFGYIPVETLSMIYEQFLDERGEQRATGAYYTPEQVAEYVLAELTTVAPPVDKMRLLDPSCGSGIFLVVAYRQLVERKIAQNNGRSPSAQVLKRLLTETVFGVEKNVEACYVTEFSLLLTLLSYVKPPELEKNGGFKFPPLHQSNIFHGDFFDDHSEFAKQQLKFHWVVGNPPWNELDPKDQDNWAATTYMDRAALEGKVVARYRVHEAFTWRATDFLDQRGWVALIIQATSLTNEESESYRRAFFERNSVARITNFSNFAYRLFPSSQAPAATLVFQPANDEPSRSITHYGPFVANQMFVSALKPKQGTPVLTMYESDIQSIDPADARTGSGNVWKLALWGSYRDQQALTSLRRCFPLSLKDFIKTREWTLQLGIQLRDKSSADKKEGVSELSKLPLLDLRKFRELGRLLEVPKDSVVAIPTERNFIRVRGGRAGLAVARAPHVYLSTTFAVYSDLDFVLPHPQVGLSGPAGDADYLRSISLLFASSFVRYLLFFDSPSWGIFTSTVGLRAVERTPVPALDQRLVYLLSSKHRELAALERQSVQRGLYEGDDTEPIGSSELQGLIDDSVGEILEIPGDLQIMARDFMGVRYLLNKGKTPKEAVGQVAPEMLSQYGRQLKAELDEFAQCSHQIELFTKPSYVCCRIALTESPSGAVSVHASDSSLDLLWSELMQEHSQWAYVQRSLRVFDRHTALLVKPNRVVDWTQSQALLDSDDVIAELVSEGKGPR